MLPYWLDPQLWKSEWPLIVTASSEVNIVCLHYKNMSVVFRNASEADIFINTGIVISIRVV